VDRSRQQQILHLRSISSNRAIDKLVDDGEDQMELHPKEALMYLNASQFVNRRKLSNRFVEIQKFLGEEEQKEMESKRLRVHLAVVKQCVRGERVCVRTKLLCEGQLVRAVLGASKDTHILGFAEAWLCVASQLLDPRLLKPVFDHLPRLYDQVNAERDSVFFRVNLRGQKRADHVMKQGDVLYTHLCAFLIGARESLPSGFYEFQDDDVQWPRMIDLRTGRYLHSDPGGEGGEIEGVLSLYRQPAVRSGGVRRQNRF
jgi:hypothetical protein